MFSLPQLEADALIMADKCLLVVECRMTLTDDAIPVLQSKVDKIRRVPLGWLVHIYFVVSCGHEKANMGQHGLRPAWARMGLD